MTVAEQLQHDTERFQKFVQRLIAKDPELKISFDDAVQLFHEYEARMDRLREELRPAYEASLRGESTPWSKEEVWQELEERMKKRGIPE